MKVLDAFVGLGLCDRTENPDDDFFERYDFKLEADNSFPSMEEINLLSQTFRADKTTLNFTNNPDNDENCLWLEFWFHTGDDKQ